MDNLTFEYVIKALDFRIDKISTHVNYINSNLKEWNNCLETKKDVISNLSISVKYDENTFVKLIKENTKKRDEYEKQLNNYKYAKAQILKEFNILEELL